MPKSFLPLIFLLLLVISCSFPSSTTTDVETAEGPIFYYWKTTFNFHRSDRQLYDSLGVKQLYLRYFDVEWSESLHMPVPLSSMHTGGDWWSSQQAIYQMDIVPVIYLVNEVFTHDYDWEILAKNMSTYLREKHQQLAYEVSGQYSSPELADTKREEKEQIINQHEADFLQLKVIQFDCDWTTGSRDNYFAFLKAMQQEFPKSKISCTLRLHQFRDRESAGIPPVERALLMCYNVAPPNDINTRQAIYDEALVDGYLKALSYPIPLDASVPLFSWVASFHEGEFKGLLAGMQEKELKNNPLFKPLSNHRYQVQQDTVLQAIYLREGDLLRADGPEKQSLEKLVDKLRKHPAIDRLFYFDWNPQLIRHYDLAY